MTTPWIRPSVAALQPYIPGEQPQEPGWIKLNTNENPALIPQVVEALGEAATDAVRFYPDPVSRELRQALAERYGVPVDGILCGNGSDELLTLAVRVAAGEGDRVAFPDPSYSLYETLARIQNAFPVAVPLGPEWALPVADLAAVGARLTFVANPNAPTGTPYTLETLAELARQVEGLLLIDEAYVDFGGETALPLVGRFPHVLVLRTMSKAFGLAGMRLGYVFGTPETITALRKVQDSYPVDRLTQVAGIAALRHYDDALAGCREIADRRDRYADILRQRFGWKVWPSATNFVLAEPAGQRAAAVFEGLRRHKILVRYFPRPPLDRALRISVGAEAEMAALVRALQELLG